MIDERIDFFVNSINAASNNLNNNSNSSYGNKISSQCHSSNEVKDFLDNPTSSSLKVIIFSEGKLSFTQNLGASISYEDNNKVEIVFIKRRNESINPQNISNLLEVHTSMGSPLEGLYNSLHNIWNPTLLKNNQWSEKLPPRIQLLLSELESSLSETIKSDNNFSSSRGIDIESVSEIFEPNDEFKFWSSLKDDRRSPYRSIAKKIDKLFSEISGFTDIFSLDQISVLDFLNQTFDVLNSIWTIDDPDKQFYPQIRMEHLFDCFGSLISKYVQSNILKIEVWKDRLGDVRLSLQSAIQVFEVWVDIPRKLTGTFWSGGLHTWKGKPFDDLFIKSYKNRLEKVLQIRVVSDELCQLLTSEERNFFEVEKLFLPLENTKPLLYNPYTEPIFNKAVEEYEKLIEPIESAVSVHFRKNLSALLDRPQTLLREFQKYESILQRPTIRKDIASERETLLSLLRDIVKKLDNAVDKLEQGREDVGNDDKIVVSDRTRLLSPRIAGIVYLRQIGSKIQSILSTSKHVLYDLDGYIKFVSLCESLLHRIKSEESGRYDAWLTDIRDKIENDDPSLKLSGALMAWKNGILSVNFSDELVRFLREVRQLDELGFDIPKSPPRGSNSKGKIPSITEKAIEADRFYRYGILLKKTANFYNSLSEQMIDIQQELLLDSLNAFGNIITKQSSGGKSDSITWSNPSECEKYISIVQEAAEKLSNENRWLRKLHESLCGLTVQLMNIDLLKQSDQWKLKWKQIKETMNNVKNKYSAKDSYTWVLHWDHQIFKALEASYQIGLESINENLTEIKAEIFFNQLNKKLEYKPSIEQLRQSYYNELKKFINIPNNFEGFGNLTIYRKMCLTNQKTIYRIYFKTELLFDKIINYLKKYHFWTYLAQVHDLDQFISTYVISVLDYQVNFKTLKQKKKDIEKLPDVEKIDCFTISLVPFKSFLDDLIQQVNDQLLIVLRRNLLNDFKEVSNFLDSSLERLSTRPKSVEEIGIAKRQWKEIDNMKDQVKELSKICVEKKKLLLVYAPGTPIDISEISNRMANLDGEGGRWDDFDIALEAFNDMIEQQKEVLKVTLEDQTISLNESITKFKARWLQLKPSADGMNFEYKVIQKIFNQLDDWKNQFSGLENQSVQLTESCAMFGMTKPRFEGLDVLSDDISSTCQSWDMLKDYFTEFNSISSQDWIAFSVNVYTLQDFAMKWSDLIKQSFNKNGSSQVSDYIYETVDKIKKSIPVLKYCRGEAFKEDHWTELLQGKLKLPSEINKENVKVDHFLLKLDILIDPSTLTYVKNLQTRATGEVQIREALRELKNWEQYTDLKLLLPEESGRKIPLVKDWKDLFIELSEKQSLLASLKESPFFKAFSDQGNVLDSKIIQLDFCLHTLNLIQRKWLYLEPIFSKGSLPSEEKKFKSIDENLSDVMFSILKDSKLFSLIDVPNISDKLKVMLDQLEKCQKALTEYLEIKRSILPRFYFIGDDDLLEILGQAKNPLIIQSHLKKLFQGIHKVSFNHDSTQITAMLSSMNEIVNLESPVTTSDKVEEWLYQLEVEMRSTLSSLLISCLREKSLNWNYPSQILCLSQSIRFTEEAEIAIEDGVDAVIKLRKQLESTLLSLTSVDLSNEPLIQIKMKSLVFDLVHEIDILDQVLKNKVSKVSDWFWKKQLRYYIDSSTNKAIIRMHDATFEYTYEYQGNAPRLVHTPLTDKCYLTLTQGMKMGFGGNPYGPAGTGKTESVKALAQCFGRQVLVFNCDEALESTSMIRIFIGIVKCGAWGCFDEFNRLKEDQLSAISQQIQIIQDAIKNRISSINLLGRNIDVNYNSGIFVTLNPAGKGYGGRSRLPDNLKALFRPVAMGAPDNELIAEVSLVTEGFTQAKDLASKIVSLFKLSRQLLSQQQHYDWGLRALKAVLNSGGRIIQSYKSQGQIPTKDVESEILIKAVRVNTLSKLTYGDTIKFLSLIGDVFPGIESGDISGGELEAAIKEVIKEKPFLFVEDSSQIKKMIQLKESLDQRIGCVIVGPSGCGKSSLWRVLKAALIKCGKPVVTYVMNPKSMPRERLLGHMDIDTREWSDGVLTDAARKVVKEPTSVSCWIICDGDVDPEWIESLNSVLDDNRLLTLPNGERISFGSNINFLFETHDLKFASPATVSRMGMIFLSDEDLDIKRLIQKWLNTFPNERQLIMTSWLDELFYKSIDYVLRNDLVVDTTLVGTVMNGLSQIKDANSRHEFICGLIRGLGGNLTITQRSSLGKEVFQWSNERPPDLGSPLDCYGLGNSFIQFTASSNNHDIEVKDIGKTAVIPTVTIQRTLISIEHWINNMEPFILVGPEGCGKSLIINHAFKQKKNIGITTLHCNAQTSADDIISKISQTCSLYSSSEGRVYRPRDCDRLVLYLKDINLPHQDIYETCQLIAFLQQLITFDGFYDSNLEFLKIEKIQIVASMNAATTVGRHILSTRFTAVVRILVVDYPEKNELVSVYDQFLSCVLKSVNIHDKRWLSSDREKLSDALIDIYEKCRDKFTVDDQRHYLFTPRDITLWVVNICRYDLTLNELLDVLTYESYRIFRDRLVNNESTSRFDQIISGTFRQVFRHNVIPSESLYYTSLTASRGQSSNQTASSNKKIVESKESDDNFDLIIESVGGKLSRMQEEEFKVLVGQGVMYYEREEKDLNALLYPELLEHIAHIDRSLSSYNHGHLLLVGKSGVGRRLATTIASYMLGYEFFTPSISRNYQSKQFLNDLKDVLVTGGIRGDHITLFIEDYQIVSNNILEIINSLLSSGEVPGMYTHEELELLLSPLREKMHESGGNYRTPYEFFIARVRKYVHVVMCMDPNHLQFLYRCESNPALYSQCTILWIGQLRQSSMQIIPTLMEGVKDLVISKNENEVDDYQESKFAEEKDNRREKSNRKKTAEESKDSTVRPEELINTIISIHSSMIDSDATPKDFITLLQTWKNLFESKHLELNRDLTHLKAGLSKLESASQIVNDLRTNAAQQEKDLRNAQEAADRAMEEISKALGNATERRHEVAEVKRVVAENELKTQQRKKVIEQELADIQPKLDAAKQAVGQIRSEHLNEIRSLTAPPEAIADVLAAVLMMLGVQDLSWLSMKRFLSNRGVKEDILNFDAKRMSNDLRKSVAKLIKKKSNSFDDDVILRVSAAAAPMAAWVKANISYSIVIEKIEPLQQELEEEVFKLQESEKRLVKCEDELNDIDKKVSSLKQLFAERTSEAERLKRNLAIAGSTLDKAEKLINQLSSEQIRWKAQVISLSNDITKLPSKMLLASGFSTYLAKESEDVRDQKLKIWLELLQLPSFSFKRTLTTESELLEWKAMGLPSDDLSQENGLVIVNKSIDRIPFIIDPASIATDWLKSYLSMDKTKPVDILLHHDSRFTNQLELAVRFGKILMIVEVDGVEPLLYPLCRKDLYHQGPRYMVNLGEKTIDYNENFRLYLITRNPNPDIPPDAASLVTQINFTITKSGLEGQLLGIAIQNDQPELEKAKSIMLNKEEDFKVQLANLEKDLLQSLAVSEGNLLENTTLIESLSKTKQKAGEIEEALKQSNEASVKLDQQREVYRPLAVIGSKLFFLIKSLVNVCHMYQYSLISFIQLFKKTLTSSEISSNDISTRLDQLCYDIEIRLLFFISRTLFKSDRLMYTLHLIKIMHPEQFLPKEWDIFLGSYVSTTAVSSDSSNNIPKNFPSWGSTDRYDSYRLLQEHLPLLLHQLELENTSKWTRFAKSAEAERDLPSLRGISAFQKVLIVQTFRPDRLHSALYQFCNDTLRIESINPPALSLITLYEESNSKSPILLVSSPGADPSKELEEYASRTVGLGSYEELAMGGGQQEIAIQLLHHAANNGTWLCLKNLHLVVSWLPILEKEISSLDCHHDFRLWLTSEQHVLFPSILLQQSLKATYEAPPGIKKNLQGTFDSWSADTFDVSITNNPIKSRLLFLLASFHAVLQERRNYIPQGWTKFYEFSYGDLRAGSFVIEAATEVSKRGGKLDWQAVHGLMEDAIYGGRIDNVYDIRVLRAHLNIFFTDRLASDEGVGQEIILGTPLRIPSNPDYISFKKIISQLPDVDAPYVFSLPDNVERSLQRSLSTQVIKLLRALSTIDVEVSKYDREKWRVQLGPILDLWNQLTSTTQGLVNKRSREIGSTNKKSVPDPVDDFVLMEFDLASDLCAIVDISMKSLKKVLFGTGLLTPSIQQVGTSLLSGDIPQEWAVKWDRGPEKPQAWIRELVRKRIALNKWKSALSKGDLLNEAIGLGDLFNPATFINALRQQTARKLNKAIDKMKMISSWDKDSRSMKSVCPLPCTLTNLLLQGASFIGGYLQEPTSDANEITPTPSVHIGFVADDNQAKSFLGRDVVDVPVYLNPSREEFLMELQVPAKGDNDKWVLAGVAIFLSEDN